MDTGLETQTAESKVIKVHSENNVAGSVKIKPPFPPKYHSGHESLDCWEPEANLLAGCCLAAPLREVDDTFLRLGELCVFLRALDLLWLSGAPRCSRSLFWKTASNCSAWTAQQRKTGTALNVAR